jgi:hypothetical protein
VGRSRGATGGPRADLGLAGIAAATSRRCSCADLGIACTTFRRPCAFRARTELGRTCAGSSAPASPSRRGGARLGRAGRARTVMGCAASGCASASATRAASFTGAQCARAARAASRSTGRGAFLERTSGGSRASLGRARRAT